MGSYGIGVGRNMASVVETSHDDKGIVWPVPIAPFEVVVTVVKMDDEQTVAAAETLYESLGEAGVDVIIDDREERPGVKFADAELVGIPYRVTVGPKSLSDGVVEVLSRSDGAVELVAVDEVAAALEARITSERTG